MRLRVIAPGVVGYRDAWELQKRLSVERFEQRIPDTLLLLEHPPTITIGRGGDVSHIVASPSDLEEAGIEVVPTDRGGDVTYHGPGQLVGYPILDLRSEPHAPDLHRYLRTLEEVLIQTLLAFDLAADRFPNLTGVWIGMDTPHPEKIAAIGVKVSRWVTLHGFALNVAPEMRHFETIVPCGIWDYGVTSLARCLQRPITLCEVIPPLVSAFAQIFDLELETSHGKIWG